MRSAFLWPPSRGAKRVCVNLPTGTRGGRTQRRLEFSPVFCLSNPRLSPKHPARRSFEAQPGAAHGLPARLRLVHRKHLGAKAEP